MLLALKEEPWKNLYYLPPIIKIVGPAAQFQKGGRYWNGQPSLPQ